MLLLLYSSHPFTPLLLSSLPFPLLSSTFSSTFSSSLLYSSLLPSSLLFAPTLLISSLLYDAVGGVCAVTSLCLDQEQPPERTKMDDPHVLSGAYVLQYFAHTSDFSF